MIRNKQQKFRKYGKAPEVLPPGVQTPGHIINPEAIASGLIMWPGVWTPGGRTSGAFPYFLNFCCLFRIIAIVSYFAPISCPCT